MNTLIKGQNFLIFPDLSLSEMIFIPAGVKPFEVAEPLLPFWIGKYPVTQILWHRVIPNYNPSRFKGGKRPVENVPLKMIVEQFLPTLNSKQKHGQGWYRLPTQSEWSYAAGPGCEDKVEENIYPSAWTYDCSHLESKPAGLKLANKFGLYVSVHGTAYQKLKIKAIPLAKKGWISQKG